MESREATPRTSPLRKVASIGLLLVGIQLWLVTGHGDLGTRLQWRVIAVIGALSLTRLSHPLARLIDRVREPSPLTRALIAVAIALLAAGYFLLTAHLQDRAFAPIYVDESSYAIGAQMAARFRLWYPSHPIGEFFEALELLIKPVYASMYFPGTAILFAPTVWLGIPFWLFSAMAAGACVGLTYRIVAELFDGFAGILAAAMVIGATIVRLVSVMFLSQVPLLLLVLLVILSWLRWRSGFRIRWAILVGVFCGWAAITRPLDAIALLAPVLVTAMIDLRRMSQNALLKTVGSFIAGAAPFLAIQLIFNIGVTGSWHHTPFQLGQSLDYPQTEYGFHSFNPAINPSTSLPQKLEHYQAFTIPSVMDHTPAHAIREMFEETLPQIARYALPHAWLLLLIPSALLMPGGRHWVILVSIPLWIGIYVPYVFHLPHYHAVLAPALAVAVIAGIWALVEVWPERKDQIAVFCGLSVLALSVTQLPELNHRIQDQWFDAGELTRIDSQIHATVHKPAVVLFRFAPESSQVEPVYNRDVPWPDAAEIVRAHDLGSVKNQSIFDYYGAQQPGRNFYLYDRTSGTLTPLGTARELQKLPPAGVELHAN